MRTWWLNLSKDQETQILENVSRHEFIDFRVYDAGATCLGQVAGLIVAESCIDQDGLILQLLEPMASDHLLNLWLKTEVVDVYGQMYLHLCRRDHRDCPARHANPKVKLVHSDFWRSRAASDMSRGEAQAAIARAAGSHAVDPWLWHVGIPQGLTSGEVPATGRDGTSNTERQKGGYRPGDLREGERVPERAGEGWGLTAQGNRHSRLVFTDISSCPGRVKNSCRQQLSDLGCTCVCSPVDILDYKHGLQKAAGVENFELPPGGKFDLVIIYGISYGTHGAITARGTDAYGVEEQLLRPSDQWSYIGRQCNAFQGQIQPGQLFTQAVLGQEAGTTVVLVEPFNFMNWQSTNLEIPTLHVRLLNRSHFKGRTSRGLLLGASEVALSCFVASDQVDAVASYCVRNRDGQKQLDLALLIQAALHRGKWIHWAACGRMDFARDMLDPSLFTETQLAQTAVVGVEIGSSPRSSR